MKCLVLLAVAALLAGACSSGDEPPVGELTAVERGQKIYNYICIACHHPDPTKDMGTAGTQGPAIADSSFELVKTRVLSTSYPEGYKPKRSTNLMTTFKLKESELRDLHAFLADAHQEATSGEANGK